MLLCESYSKFFPHLDGKFPTKLPSITKVLSATSDKTHLEAWKARIGEEEANRISKEASEFGTSLHLLIENHLLGIEQTIPKSSVGFTFQNILGKLKTKTVETIGIELPMQSTILQIGGRCDYVGIIDGKLCILDWKTAKDRKPKAWISDYFLQCTAYALCFKEMTGELPKKLHIVLGNSFMCQWETEDLSREWVGKLKRRVGEYYNNINSYGGSVDIPASGTKSTQTC